MLTFATLFMRGPCRVIYFLQISTVVQFRILDYGMESCQLVLETPAYNGTDRDALIHSSDGEMAVLDVWALDAPKKLEFNTLTWNSKPKRATLFTQLYASYGLKHETSSFACSSASYQTFEVVCSNCHIDIMRSGWQAGGRPIHLLATATLIIFICQCCI
jgi:hypothetical protein